jgi:cardiolipin synthase
MPDNACEVGVSKAIAGQEQGCHDTRQHGEPGADTKADRPLPCPDHEKRQNDDEIARPVKSLERQHADLDLNARKPACLRKGVDARGGQSATYVPDGMTTANKITILRILLVPFFVVLAIYYEHDGVEIYRWLAFASFALAAISDGVDGYLARRYNQRSELGAVLDPLADKLLLVSGIVLLSFTNQFLPKLPIWLTATVLSRDVMILLGLVVIHVMGGKVIVRPRVFGKIATVMQMTTVMWALLKWDAPWLRVWVWGATLFTALSGVLYVYDGVQQLNASPSSAPAKKQ